MSSNSANSREGTQETGKSSSAWSAFSSKFQDFRQKAKSKGYELAGYANQQSRSIMSRIKKEEPVKQPKERYVFGVPLEYVMANAGHEYGIPLIVYQCINELTYSVDEVGLYRIPGSNHQVEILRDKFDYLESVDLTGENPNTVATLLKLYLRQLPNKLIDEEHNIKLNDIIRKYNIENPEEFTEYEEVAEVLEDLPGWEYNLIGYICFHLKSVADNAESNKMTINNLGLIFCPTLKISPAVFSVLVIHSQKVFRRFLSNEEADYSTECSNENYDENEDKTHTNEQDSDDKADTLDQHSPEESNVTEFDKNQEEELVKVNDDKLVTEEKEQNQKADENTSDTLISLEDETKVFS